MEYINFYACTCGCSWSGIFQERTNSHCPSCGKDNIAIVAYDIHSEEFAKTVISAEEKIANLEELCQRAYHEIDSGFQKLCDEDGYGPVALISDLEKVKNGQEYKGMSTYIKALSQALETCEKNKLKK